ncbi:MAG: hypothetical protein ACI81S_001142 [Sphingobacteriales bacterium]|jgi:hypothetical protein
MMRILSILLLMAISVSAYSQASGDAYGYKFKTSDDPTGPAGEWFDLTDAEKYPNALEITDKFDDDSFFGPLNFSFDFQYYWYTRSQVYVASNGYIGFLPDNISAAFPSIPVVGGKSDDYMAPFMSDLSLGGEVNAGRIFYYTDFKDTVIVSWLAVPYFGAEPNSSNTFQVVLSRADSSITFNYMAIDQGHPFSGLAGHMTIGIENVSGGVGNLHSHDDLPQFVAKTFPYSINFKYPKDSEFKTNDLKVKWNNNSFNRGIFVNKDGKKEVVMKSSIFNQGLTTSPQVVMTGKLAGPVAVEDKNIFLKALEPGEERVIEFKGMDVPLTEEGVYTFRNTISYDDDRIKGNNQLTQMITVVDTTVDEIILGYEDAINGEVSFTGAVDYSVGLGTYIIPPFFPAKITKVTVGVANTAGTGPTTEGVRVIIQDDNGISLSGERDGSPGDTLETQDILPGAEGETTITLAEPIQINSGGLYIAAMQGGTSVGIGTNNAAPTSFTAFEVVRGFYVPFRDRKTEDPVIRLHIEKGDLTETADLAVTKLISPDTALDITDSVEVEVELTNLSEKAAIAGPFEISYQINQKEAIFEIVPAEFTLAAGETTTYKFAQKAARPPAPKTKFESVCAVTYLDNDFVKSNDTLCVTTEDETSTAVSVNDKFDITVYPNPIVENATISYTLNNAMDVTLEVIDMQGKVISNRMLKDVPAGKNKVEINFKGYSKGIYLVRMAGDRGQNVFPVTVK